MIDPEFARQLVAEWERRRADYESKLAKAQRTRFYESANDEAVPEVTEERRAELARYIEECTRVIELYRSHVH